MIFTGKDMINALVYFSNLNCANAQNFLEIVSPNFDRVEYEKHKVQEKLSQVIAKIKPKANERINEGMALNALIADDLAIMKANLKEAPLGSNPISDIQESHEKFRRMFMYFGIDVSHANLRLLDKFPRPYENLDASAMNYDIYDEKKFGIPIGVCLKRDRIIPGVSIFLLGHELVHSCFSKVYAHFLARGLEEGLCDLVSLIFTSNILGFQVAKNILTNLRVSHSKNQFWGTYKEALRQASLLYKNYGFDGIMDILKIGYKRGRVIVKEIEKNVIQGDYDEFNFLSKGAPDSRIENFLNFYIGYPHSLRVNPLARYLAEKIAVGNSVKEVLSKYNIDVIEGKRAIHELQERIYIVLLDNDEVISDETNPFIRARLLRYDCK